MAVDLNNYKYSFAHAIIRVGDRQFTGIRSVSVNQELTEAAVYGTGIRPEGRSVGQLQIGRGTLIFSDFGEGLDFWSYLAPQPLLALWDLDYALVREDGSTRSVECISCRLLGSGIEHESGPDALEVSYPFSFLAMRKDGFDTVLDAKQLANAALNVAQNLVNLL